MKLVYGKQDWKTFERGLENCYLLTNGLGGFSSLTVTGAAARGDHAFFMACTKAPNHRFNMIQRLEEGLILGEEHFPICAQEFISPDGERRHQDGCRFLSEFSFEDTPVWRFHVKGVEIEKEIALRHGENTAAVCWRITNRTRKPARLAVTPYFRFAQKGKDMQAGQVFTRRETEYLHPHYACGMRIESRGLALDCFTNGKVEDMPWNVQNYYYAYDACDGRPETGTAGAGHRIVLCVEAGRSGVLEILYTMSEEGRQENAGFLPSVQCVIEEEKRRRRNLARKAGFSSETACLLAKSADQFLSERQSTGGKTILAGFPFFEDWGRDTMVALPGVCLSTGRYEEAKSILRTFVRYEKDGLMPNLFPEGKNDPMYNTADAALLFINCVYLYFERTQDMAFVREVYPVMERITDCYQKGTRFGIHMDADGLLAAGEELDQVTWMDVRAGDVLPTPRHGKPVEINAYWYNALQIMAKLSTVSGRAGGRYEELAQRAKTAFNGKFWMEDKCCLKDVLSGTDADGQIRCNQIWTVSMPFTMMDAQRERQVVDTVFEKLYTPYGLRTLAPDDAQFHPVYEGEMFERDMAYHQGTVWAYPLGAYYLAYLKVNHYSEEAKECARAQLEAVESAVREGCAGQLPEIYDGENPVSSKGCFAQAWSTGELLRVYEALERGNEARR